MSPALPVLIQIPVFLCAAKSPLYNFNFLQGLIPWPVVAQTLNPSTPPLAEGLRPLPTQHIGGRHSWAPSPSPTPHEHPSPPWHLKCLPPFLPSLPSGWMLGGWRAPGTGCGRGGGSVGESPLSAAHLPPRPTRRSLSHFLVGWCSGTKIHLFLAWIFFFWLVFRKERMGPCLPRALRGFRNLEMTQSSPQISC